MLCKTSMTMTIHCTSKAEVKWEKHDGAQSNFHGKKYTLNLEGELTSRIVPLY